MNVLCSAEPCPIILNATCVHYEGGNLVYTGINTNDNLQVALEKINDTIQNLIITGPYVPLTRLITINGITQDLSVDRTWTISGLPSQTGNAGKWLTTNGTNASWANLPPSGVSAVTASTPLASSGGATPNITIQQASGSQAGYLSSTDWTTFNSKVGGSGTATRIAYWNTASSISSDTDLYWDDVNKYLGIGTSTPSYPLHVDGAGYINGDLTISSPNYLNLSYVKLGGSVNAFGLDYVTFQATTGNTGIAVVATANGNPIGYGYAFQFKANQVANQLLFVGDNTTQAHYIHTDASPGGNGWPLIFGVAPAGQNWNTSSNLLVLTAAQNIGIGTTSPTYKLDLVGNQSITGYLNFKPTGAPTQIKIGSADNIVGGTSTSANLVLIGQLAGQALSHATTNDSLIGIGYNAGGSMTSGGTYSIHIGRNSGIGITTGIFNTHIGTTNSTTLPAATSNTIHILGGGGYDLDNAGLTLGSLTSRYALIGGGYNGAYYINDFYFGAGPFISDPANANLSFYAPSARGTDLVGPNFTINAGRGTGTGTPGDILFATSTATSTGTTVQTLSQRMKIAGETGEVTINNLATGGVDEMVTVDSTGKLKKQIIPSGTSPLTTKGDIYTFSTTNDRLPVGTNGYVLSADSTTATGLKWITPPTGGVTRSINPVSGNTSAGSTANTDYYYFVSALATITLPTAASNTNQYTIKRTGSGVVTIATTSSQTIDGSLTIALNVVNQSVTLISDGSNWQII